jgi:hypothetical protein
MRRRTYLTAAAVLLSLGGCSENAEIATPMTDTTATPRASEQPPTQSQLTSTDAPQETQSDTPQDVTPQDVTPQGTPSEAPLKINYDVEAVKQDASVVTYDTLVQNIDAYRGEPIYYEYAKVYRVIPAGAHTQVQLSVSTTSRDWQGVIGADWNDDEGLAAGQIIQMWGFVRGLYQYQTAQGETRLAPSVQMVDYEQQRRE